MNRPQYLEFITFNFKVHPICAILGPRQVGKTTLARQYVEQFFVGNSYFFDLENPLDIARLENPMLTLQSISEELIVIDEIQLRPELFPVLRVLVDMTRTAVGKTEQRSKKFLILGSVSRDLIQQSSETLAGRIGYIELSPFSLMEVKDNKRLWLRGGFPNSYLADNDADSYLW